VRSGATSPKVSHARSADEEIPTRLATSLMRKVRVVWCIDALDKFDALDEFFLLDTGPGFL
jgi:hypothetical protein